MSDETTSAPASPPPPPKPSWRNAWRVYLEPASLRMLALGFSAGLPIMLVLGTLSFRLRESGVDLATIGFLSWVGLAYAFKWCWAPLVDRLPLPGLTNTLGRRRGWLLASQFAVVAGLVGMAQTDPRGDLQTLVLFAVLVAVASATQDIALDAFRIESAGTERQAALAATYQTGYRLALIWAGAGVLWIAAVSEIEGIQGYQAIAWRNGYLAMAASMLVGIVTVLTSSEPVRIALPTARSAPEWLRQVLIEPFADFIIRYRWQAALILSLIAVYRISDVVMGIMANPFYVDMGYTKAQVATVSKVYGVIMTLVGAFLGGILAMRIGVMRVLMLGAVLSAATNLMFAWLSTRGPEMFALVLVISADNLASGIASAAFIAYLSSLTNIRYSATQYALFSSMMVLAPKWLAGFSGVYVKAFGYGNFFVSTALLGVPVLVLVAFAARMQHKGAPPTRV